MIVYKVSVIQEYLVLAENEQEAFDKAENEDWVQGFREPYYEVEESGLKVDKYYNMRYGTPLKDC